MKPPTIQIVLDAKGMPLTESLMRHLEACVMCIFGAKHKMFWITRSDIYSQFIGERFVARLLPERIASENFHEASADLYIAELNNGYPANVPYGRIINLKIPE